MNLKTLPIGIAALLMAGACSEEAVYDDSRNPGITFNTCITRAKNITSTNDLKDFRVWAFSDIVDSEPFINGLKATRPAGKDYYTFDHSIFWPSDINTLHFWAIGPVDPSIAVENNAKKLSVKGFSPVQEPENQIDLIADYKKVDKEKGTTIDLYFRHTLSNIEVKATGGVTTTGTDDDPKTVYIKGVWFVNPYGKGTLVNKPSTANQADDPDNPVLHTTDLDWTNLSDKTFYGKEFTNVIGLDPTQTPLLCSSDKTNLLLIPQNLNGWDIKNDNPNISQGAYILFLCRVEAKHKGALHEGTADASVKTEGETHIHQLFPYTGNFDRDEYGFSCVPVGTNWEPSKRYTYSLSFCGAGSGAGIYPPELPDGIPSDDKYIRVRPEGKRPGDPVLDYPISFNVTVEDWTDHDWTPGNPENPDTDEPSLP